MNKRFCPNCGWGSWISTERDPVPCRNPEDCRINAENVRKYMLRNKDQKVRPKTVRSVRYQGPEGKGDCSEQLIPAF